MNIKSVFTSIMLAGAVGLCLAAQPASANIGRETSSQTVRYRDLNLSQTEDAQALLRRIRRAATLVCTGSPSLSPMLIGSRDARNCIRQASGDAVGRLNHPVVTAMYGAPAPVQVASQ